VSGPGSRPPVTIAVVNFNGARYLPDCLAAIAAQTVAPLETLVVDNDSTDGSAALAEGRPGVRVLRLGTNFGPGSARNAGLAAATTRLVLLMDNDVILQPDCLERLLEAFLARDADAPVALVQARTVFDDRPDLVQCDGGTIHFLGAMILRHGHLPVAGLGPAAEPVDSAITTAVLVDRDRIRSVGGFDEEFFIYFEDHDCAVRARLAGFELLAAGAAVVRHRGGTADLSFRTGGTYTARRFYLQLRNRWLFVLKNYPLRTLLALLPALAMFEAFSFGYTLKKGFLTTWFRAAFWMVGHAPQILARRREARARARVRLATLLQDGPYPLHPGLLKGGWQTRLVGLLDGATNTWWRVVRGIA